MTLEIAIMLGLFLLACVLFVTEWLRVDVTALVLLALLGLSDLFPQVELLNPRTLFIGFSSNAVISLIAVMILGAGLHRTGVMNRIIYWILEMGHSSERWTISLLSAAAGLLSSVFQNIGSAALFVPVANKLSQRTGVARGRLMMPMAFAALVGGTLTMIGSSPLIMLQDLLPHEIKPLALFEVAPVGLALLAATILYFVLVAYKWLPKQADQQAITQTSAFFQDFYSTDADIYEVHLPNDSPLTGRKLATIERAFQVRFVGAQFDGDARIAPAKDLPLEPNSVIAVLCTKQNLLRLVEAGNAHFKGGLEVFSEALIQTRAGVSEIVIPPSSDYADKTIGELGLRKTQGLAVLAVKRDNETHYKNLREFVLKAGDMLICHSSWKNLARVQQNKDLALLTADFPQEEVRPFKVLPAILCLAFALTLILATDILLPVALISGAIGMIVFGVLTVDEAYGAISWKTVFLLSGLIPMGLAAEHTGTAQWLANQTLSVIGMDSPLLALTVLFVAAGALSLLISNVGATVLLVPIAISLATTIGADPRLYALATALGATNAFLLPTHPVNVLTMGAGGYTVKDYLKVGAPMSILYGVVTLGTLSLIF